MNEAETRAELIDPQLEAAGWKTDSASGVRVRREYDINAGEIKVRGMRVGRLKADYILEYKNRKLAVVEAKSNEVDVSEGVAQAKLYAQKLQLKTSFAANGKEIYEIDHLSGNERKIKVFPSPEELWEHAFGEINEWLEKFNAVPFEYMGGMKEARYYQELAVNHAVEAIAKDKKRILLTLATGTGKTFIAFQIAWKLFKSRWTRQKDGKRQPRILFLTDRNILANQAYLDFGAFDDDVLVRVDPKIIERRGEVPKNGNVFFTIFQTFMTGQDGQHHFCEYEPDFFDLIIIDECHRGGANDESTWRGILDYFSGAVHLGLTATPKRRDNVDTYQYFGEPVFTYSLKEGVKDGFLTPFKLKRIQTTIDEYVYAGDDEILTGEAEDGRIYTEEDFNRHIEIIERERKRVQEMLISIKQDEKTLVFCASQVHAAKVRDLINQEADSSSVDYCVRVTSDDDALGDIYLRQFQDNEKNIPTILTTSHKLTTGVDARNVRNIVLMRPIKSMIEFKQIIGRGTRLFEGKFFFTIIDFVGAYHLFSDPEWDGEPVEPEEDDTDRGCGGDNSGENGNDGGEDDDGDDEESKDMLRIKLSDGKERAIKSMSNTYFYVDGKPVSAEDYLKHLFDTLKLPELLGSEEELRQTWANPLTRNELLNRLTEHGCSRSDLKKLQELIDARDSDLFDVLEYITYAKPTVSRAERVEANENKIYNLLDGKQQEFVSFVLRNYVTVGIDELDASKLSVILESRYGGLHEAEQELGPIQEIRTTFIEFQQHLYQDAA